VASKIDIYICVCVCVCVCIMCKSFLILIFIIEPFRSRRRQLPTNLTVFVKWLADKAFHPRIFIATDLLFSHPSQRNNNSKGRADVSPHCRCVAGNSGQVIIIESDREIDCDDSPSPR